MTIASDLSAHPESYVLWGARLNHVAELMERHQVSAVPVVGYIEEFGWFGPTILGVCTERDALLACWSRPWYPYKNKPQNICVQSVMQNAVWQLYRDSSTYEELKEAYAGVVSHYKSHH